MKYDDLKIQIRKFAEENGSEPSLITMHPADYNDIYWDWHKNNSYESSIIIGIKVKIDKTIQQGTIKMEM